jgi:hypothetical protein
MTPDDLLGLMRGFPALFYLSLLAKPINLSDLGYHSTIILEVSECF